MALINKIIFQGISQLKSNIKSIKVFKQNVKESKDQIKDLTKQSEAMKKINDRFNENRRAATGFTDHLKNIKDVFLSSRKAGLSMFQSLGMSVKAFGATLTTSLLPLAAIAAAFFLLKKAWDSNLGGIQTTFYKIFGKVQAAWGKFEASLIKGMQKISPAIKSAFAIFGNIAKNIIGPVIGAFKNLFSTMSSIYSKNNSLEAIKNTFSAIGKIVKYVGMVLGFWIKVFVKIITFVAKLLDKIGVFKLIFGTINAVAKGISSIIDAVYTFLNKLPKPVKKLFGIEGGLPSATKEDAQTTNNNQQTVTNNNQKITFMTSTPTSPEQDRAFADKLAKQLSM